MTRHLCPVCGKFEFSKANSLEICPECCWQDDWDDGTDADEYCCANEMSLNEFRRAYESGWKPDWLKEIKANESL